MKHVAIVGVGPAGLMAAERLSAAGVAVTMFDRMPSVGRKFLMAGRGGLNLTHSEPLDRFRSRYVREGGWLNDAIDAFPPPTLRDFAESLGQETFVGSSGRVFPKSFKTSPLLRAWLARLNERGVRIRTRHTLVALDGHRPVLIGPSGAHETIACDATLLALGGGSWPRLGSDGGWVDWLASLGVEVAPLAAANCGIVIDWSDHFRARFEGAILKRIGLSFAGQTQRGETVVTRHGLEGGVVYVLCSAIRNALAEGGPVGLLVDLKPDMTDAQVAAKLARARQSDSRSNRWRKALSLSPAAIGLLNEARVAGHDDDVKRVPLSIVGVSGIDRAISTAGGVRASAFDERFMLRALAGVFIAGEMLDFDAPTGGYLLQAAFATGHVAAEGMLRYLNR